MTNVSFSSNSVSVLLLLSLLLLVHVTITVRANPAENRGGKIKGVSIAPPTPFAAAKTKRHTESSSQSSSGGGGQIFSQRLGEHSWSRILGNPCRADPPPSHSSPNRDHNNNVLDLRGRERTMRFFAGSTLAALADLANHLSPIDCHGFMLDTLPPLPEVTTTPGSSSPSPSTTATSSSSSSSSSAFPPRLLSDLYRSFHSLSAHFHVMQVDWMEGRSCSRGGEPDRLVQKVDRLKNTFRLGMCSLMVPADPHPLSVPYPSPAMLEEHRASLGQELLHYQDCSGRMVRDCVLVSQARRLLEIVYARATATAPLAG